MGRGVAGLDVEALAAASACRLNQVLAAVSTSTPPSRPKFLVSRSNI